MPEDETLEEKVEKAPSKTLGRRVFDLGYHTAVAAGTTFLGLVTVGPSALVIGGAAAAGSLLGNLIKNNKPLDEIVNESSAVYSTLNTVLYPVLGFGNMVYPLIPNADLIGKAARTLFAMTVHNAVFTGMFKGVKHIIDNKLNPFGIYDSVKNNFLKDCAYFGLAFAPGYALAANGVASLPVLGYKAPTFALNAFPAIFGEAVYSDKPEKKEEQQPAQPETTQPRIDPAQLQRYIQQAQQRKAA